MTFRNPMLFTASALGVLISLGAVGEAPAGQGYGPGYVGGPGYHAGSGMPHGHPAVYTSGSEKPMGKSCDSKMKKDATVVDAGTGGADARLAAGTVPAGDR